MEIIATLPPPHFMRMRDVAANLNVNLHRFNTGAKTPFSPKETLQKILELVPKEKLCMDIKGRQLRIDMWARYPEGDIVINREIEVDLPAKIIFRSDSISTIVAIEGRKIFADPGPRYLIGAGQAVNICGKNFKVPGEYLTETDRQYIEAGKELGINKCMLSFLEKISDISEVLAVNNDAEIFGKIESVHGLELIGSDCSWSDKNVRLIAARDDLFINLDFNGKKIFDALKLIIKQDPRAIVASRLLTSLEKEESVALSDLSDIYLMKEMGYQSFLLSDGLCSNPVAFLKSVSILRSF